MLGTRALQIFDETTSVVRVVRGWIEFYAHESCGKCTPCREGNYWMVQVLRRIEAGKGTQEDIDTLLDICDNLLGRSFCALGDGATSSVTGDRYSGGVHRGNPHSRVGAVPVPAHHSLGE